MIVKLDANLLALVGATGASDFTEKLSAFAAKAKENETAMAENKTNFEALEKRIEALEGKIVTEARVGEIASTSATNAIKSWTASEEGKKTIGAESSRITLEALSSVGTQPAKPSPAPAAGVDTPEAKAKDLIAQGKFEEAFAHLPAAEKADFFNAKNYAAFMRNRGNTKIAGRN